MHVDFFFDNITKITNIPLPGLDAQLRMAPLGTHHYLNQVPQAKKASVLALLYPNSKHQMHIVFILRQQYPGVHSQQISFPGGRIDTTDPNPLFTALRETHEEVGVSPDSVHVVKTLSNIYIPPSNFFVHPFLGVCKETPHFIKEEKEVSEIIEVPIQEVLSAESEGVFSVIAYPNKPMEVPAFHLQNQIVWGATAMILAEIKALFKML